MGGKEKKGQRTKGNVRPSSSSRSAELLGEEAGFVGFSGLPAGAFVPVLNPTPSQTSVDAKESELALVDSEFRVVLRKMGKKDVTTKMKALQEFGELCEKHSLDILKTVLQFWPRIYSRIAIDSDRRVREAAQKAHQQLVGKLKRLIAPHLKTFMGVWFTSQCDTYAPAASVAQNSLRASFPDAKLQEATIFCQFEILEYIEDCLLKQNMSTMGDAQTTPVEDLEQRYERVLCGALSGYQLLLNTCTREQLEKCREKHSYLWSQPKLWKVVQYNSSPSTVKAVWFSLVSATCKKYPEVVKENGSVFCKSLLSFLEESDPSVVTPLWDAVLQVMHTVEDSWNHVNPSKSIVPRMMGLLREGCYGNSRLLNSTLLQLVDLLPQQVTEVEGGRFYTLLLSNLRQGLSNPKLWMSPSEAGSLAAAFVKLFVKAAESSKENELIVSLYQEQILPLLEVTVKEKRAILISTPLIRQLAVAVYKWTEQNEEALINGFWTILEKLCDSVASQDDTEPFIWERLTSVLLIAGNPSFQVQAPVRYATRSARVRFADPGRPEEIKIPAKEEPIQVPPLFQNRMEQLAVKTCLKLISSGSGTCLPALALLLRNSSFARALMERVGNPEEFMETQIQPWLEEYRDEHCASLLFSVLENVQPARRSSILQNIVQKEEVAVPLLSTALEKFADAEAVRSWLGSEQVQQLLVKSAQLVSPAERNRTQDQLEIHWHIIRAALCAKEPRKPHESLLPNEKLDAVIAELARGLSVASESEEFAVFVNGLSSTWESSIDLLWHLPSAEKLATAALNLICDWRNQLSRDVTEDLVDIWRRSVEKLLIPRGDTAIRIIRDSLNAAETKTIDFLERLLSLTRQLLEHEEAADYFMTKLLPEEEHWNRILDEKMILFILQEEVLQGNCSEGQINLLCTQELLRKGGAHVRLAAFLSALLCQDEKYMKPNYKVTAHLICAAAAGDLITSLYCRRPAAIFGLSEHLVKLKANIDALISMLDIKEINSVWADLLEKSSSRKGLWPYALGTFQRMLGCSVSPSEASCSPMLLKNLSSKDLMDLVRTKAAQVATASVWTDGLEHLRLLRQALKAHGTTQDTELLEAVVMATDAVQHWQQQHGEDFLFGCDLSGKKIASDPYLTVVDVIRFLATVVELMPSALNASAWDFVLCSLGSWCESMEESWNSAKSDRPRDFGAKNPLLVVFSVAVCRLAQESGKVAENLRQKKIDPTGLPSNLTSEWNDVFAEAVYATIIPQFLLLTEKWTDLTSPTMDVLMESLSMSLLYIPAEILSKQLSQQGKDPLSTLSPALLSQQSASQITAYRLILKILPEIVKTEEKECSSQSEPESGDEITRPPPKPLEEILSKTDAFVASVLGEKRIGDLVTVEPYTEESCVIVAYTLVWKLIFALCSHASSELRHQYASFLGESGKLETLMSSLFCLIPHSSPSFSLTLDEDLLPVDSLSSARIQVMAAQTYAAALQNLPAVVRRWFNGTDKRVSSLVEKFTSRAVSPLLCAADLGHVTATGRSFDNMTVKIRPSVREVVAVYKLNEEASMELVVKLPANYPLGQITVEGGRKVGVSASQWRNWILQLTTFLMHQNGSILDGLTLWKRNVDKRFEGVEECYICFYVLHGSNFQLPKLSCRTCKKKFHSACLYKWFSTSNNSTCPLCRNLF